MRVDDLLALETLGLQLVWGEPALLRREVSGVTVTDLQDPAAYLGSGEIVLTGLVWWTARGGRGKADRFVGALREAGAAALVAGIARHNGIPDDLVAACREQGIPLLAVPADTTFRTITDAVYLRRWSDLSESQHRSLPEGARQTLNRLIHGGAAPELLLDQIAAELGGMPCVLVTVTGRVLARSAQALVSVPATVRRELRSVPESNHAVGEPDSPYDGWYLHLPAGSAAPPRLLREIIDVLRRYRDWVLAQRDERDRAATDLVMSAVTDSIAVEPDSLGLPVSGHYRVVTAVLASRQSRASADALRELLAAFAPGTVPVVIDGHQALAVVPDRPDLPAVLREHHSAVAACDPKTTLTVGISTPTTLAELGDARIRATYARRAAQTLDAHVTAADDLTTLPELLAGIPEPVRDTYRTRVLGELLEDDAHAALRDTLVAFLDHNGSWTRTAEAMHLHVNTVHYRIERVERLTGRDLSRLDDRLDLRTALLTAMPHPAPARRCTIDS
ncbi:PucR family transcriptional regulator [Nocardia sp. NPDC059240]|uniref:PucR family transcriptional regulator n=1 Tax=Nocardia sp. NPDC059240 TaxID=3346786 RepID=UPI00368AADB9